MGLRKPLFFFDSFFSVLCSKRRVISGFGFGVLASLLVLPLLVSVNTPSTTTTTATTSFPSSFFSWYFFGNSSKVDNLDGDANASGSEITHDGNSSVSGGVYGKEVVLSTTHYENFTGDDKNSSGLVTGESVLENAHEGNSSKSDFSGKEMDFGSTHFKNLTVHVSNSSSLVNEGSVLENSHEGNSSKSDFSGKELDLGSTHFKNLTVHVSNSSSLVNEGSVLENSHEGNSSKSDFSGKVMNFETSHLKNLTVVIKNSSTLVSSKDDGMAKSSAKKEGVEASITNGSGSKKAMRQVPVKCNIFNGRWVRDEKKPYYPAGSCPHIDVDFNCHKNGRPDVEFLKWRWQPNDCDIPSLNATDFLARLRGKRILFVGDSLNRNMWESLVCILRHSVERKSKVYEVSGRHDFKTKGYYSFRFEEYQCSVDFVRSPFLVRELYHKNANGSEDEKLRLDLLDETTSTYRGADIIVFNTGHWWTHEKTSRGIDYYQEGDRVYPILGVMEAYKKAIATWARWVDKNINKRKAHVVFRGYSLTHFRGGQWNSGGQCHKETEPIYNETFLSKYPAKMRILETVLEQMKTPVIYLNISRLTDYRKDGHPSIYRKKYKTLEEKIAAEKSQDCSHWCLPGVPDTWNELLYASLLMEGEGSWK